MGLQKISRLFLQWKMPHELRKTWPIILDSDGKIIYVPRYKKDYIERKDANLKIKKIK